MLKTNFPGRPVVLDRLQGLQAAGKLGQPILLLGPVGCGKENSALEFARLLNCSAPETCRPDGLCESCVKTLSFQHPDIRWIGPAPATAQDDEIRKLLAAKIANPFYQPSWAASSFVGIGDPEQPGPLTIRSLSHFLRRHAFQAPFKVAIVADAQRMNPAAANAFLKTLEEPPPRSVIFLLATGTEGMLPTILSRCLKIHCEPWSEGELATVLQELTDVTPAEAAQAARMSAGDARRAMAMLEPEAQALFDWAGNLFAWVHAGNRAQAAITADELHRGVLSHLAVAEGKRASGEAKDASARRFRAIGLCELLNLHYSEALACRVFGDTWHPRLEAARAGIVAAVAGRRTETLLQDIEAIDSTRRQVDQNINIGLAMAVLFEGLIDNARRDQARSGFRASS